MMHTSHRILRPAAFLALAGLAPTSKGADDPKPEDFRVFWKDSLRLETNDGQFKLRFGGRIQEDWMWSDEDSDLEDAGLKIEDGTEFRRTRIYMEGTVYENLLFKAQYDFAGGDADFKDVYMGLEDLAGAGTLLVGQFKEPWSLEEQTSSNDITFMERSLAAQAFSPERSSGAMLRGTATEDDRLWYGVGVFRDTDDYGNQTADGEYAVTGRLTGLVVDDSENGNLVELGLQASLRSKDTVRIRARPENHIGPRLVDTGDLELDTCTLLGVEAVGQHGPFSLQGEYQMASGDGSNGAPDVDFSAFYIQGAYTLTGEARVYDRHKSAFKNPKVASPFNGKGSGTGAVEVALRYSHLDLDDGAVQGGVLDDLTAGVNWYLNNNARVMANYILASLDKFGATDVEGTANIFELRFQFAF